MQKLESQTKEDVWIHTSCGMCYGRCTIMVHRVDGVVVKIEGDPNSPVGYGRMCPKGVAGIMTLYDPNRLNVPLKRTNPKKGFDEDPGWVEITWEEALDTIASKVKEVMDTDPRGLFWQQTTTGSSMVERAFSLHHLIGSPNHWHAGGGIHCGNAAHLLGGMMHASWSLLPDFQLCNYAIYFGCSKGHSAGHAANINAQMAADARARGMKLVVFDPMCNFASAKANEWIPIRPGTDAAVALAMANVLVNELGIFDVPYLKTKTNAPYLVGPDGLHVRARRDAAAGPGQAEALGREDVFTGIRYGQPVDKGAPADRPTWVGPASLHVRDPKGEPMVWDPIAGEAKLHDDPSIKDFALEGTFEVQGKRCQPAFQLLREHLRKYTPEYAAGISSVPAATIRRIATEFGQAARVGSTTVIDGVELPWRPASVTFFRGAQGHKNAAFNCIALDLLNQLVGSADMPGGALGFNPLSLGDPERGNRRYIPGPDRDGLLTPGMWGFPETLPWPPHTPKEPETMGLQEIFPHGMFSTIHASSDQVELWKKFNLPYPPKVMFNLGANSVMSVGNRQAVAEALKRTGFIVSINLFLNETDHFADIVLPDACYLESSAVTTVGGNFNHPAGLGEWCWTARVPVVKPLHQRKSLTEVVTELADRLGLLPVVYAQVNASYGLKPPHALEPNKKYSPEEVCDRALKGLWGPERGLEWFAQHGAIKWPKKVEEPYWRAFTKARVPIYFEMFLQSGAVVREICEKHGVSMDWRFYGGLVDWLPCPTHEVKDPDYDLYSFYYRDILHTNSFTMENPWLDEASVENPWTYNITISSQAARKKGIKDGDLICVETATGLKTQGKAKVSELIHPEGVGIAAMCGHWTKHQPIALGKGTLYNDLLEVDLEHTDPVSAGLDLCAKVKIYKAR